MVDAITDPDALAEEACKVDLIHPESKRILQSLPIDTKTKSRSLLQSIEGKIKNEAVLFHHFLALLKKLPRLTNLGIILQRTYSIVIFFVTEKSKSAYFFSQSTVLS